jgi:hypothetical protein
MAYVFISYSHEQKADAERAAVFIEQYNHQVFFDQDSLEAGRAFGPRIKQEIQNADLFVFLISPESVTPQRYTLSELRFAREKWGASSDRILPVMVTPTDMALIPPFLQAIGILRPEGNLEAELASAVDERCQGIEKPVRSESPGKPSFGAARGEPPKFLAYMVDRDSQRDEIRRTIPSPSPQVSDRFISYVVHGHTDDLHESIVHRYVNYTLPRHLKRLDESFEFDRKTVNWPAADASLDLRLERLMRDILKAYVLDYTGRIADIRAHFASSFNALFSKHRNPLTICFNVHAKNWGADSDELFDAVVKAMADLRISHNVILTAFFFMKIADQKKSVFSLFSKSKPGPIDDFIASVASGRPIQGVSPEDAQTMVVCLPQLTPVRRMDLESWASVTVPEVYRLIDREALIQTARTLFKDDETALRYGGIIQEIKRVLAGAST